ncbi:hypothetical protein M3Y97_00881100 [Aphelenchoides bicaudatus]|nr:hypothetical protein M3Y97_00881100 [Aphelenchoides bicaudatus]
MNLFGAYLFLFLLEATIELASCLRAQGSWDLNENSMLVVTRFAIQPIDPLFPQFTRGFIFGNVTNAVKDRPTGDLALFIVPQTRIHSFDHGDMWQLDCKALLKNISTVLYEPRCFKNGKRGDFMRWISCPVNGYCVDETIPEKVITGSQFTLRVDEPITSEFWYVVFVSCHLDNDCEWAETKRDDIINYNIELTNGHPLINVDTITKQFSFEEQNVFEIMSFAFTCFLILALVQWRASTKSRLRCSPLRSKLLSVAIGLEIAGLFVQIINMLRFIKTGVSIEAFSFFSEFLRSASECVLCLILLLLGNGWSMRKAGIRLSGSTVFYMWIVVSIFHMIFFSYGYLFIEEQRNYSDLFMLKTAREIVIIRLVQAAWFLVEIKKSLSAEVNVERALFILHFGASFMVWFTYYILLLGVSLVISEFYRLKFVIATTLFAKFIASAILCHIFWPTSSYSRFFNSDLMMHRTFSNTSSNGDSEEFNMLISENFQSDDDEPGHL